MSTNDLDRVAEQLNEAGERECQQALQAGRIDGAALAGSPGMSRRHLRILASEEPERLVGDDGQHLIDWLTSEYPDSFDPRDEEYRGFGDWSDDELENYRIGFIEGAAEVYDQVKDKLN